MKQEKQPAVSRFPVPELKNMPEDIRGRILAIQGKVGIHSECIPDSSLLSGWVTSILRV